MQFIRHDKHGYWLQEYEQYLRDNAQNFPRGARDFALAEWHYDFSHHQCPHDSWVEYVSIGELSSGKRQEVRSLEIRTRFLGAHHDGYFEILYQGVSSYSLGLTKEKSAFRGHGDWIIDEITLNEPDLVLHHIEFATATWNIHCADLHYLWIPK